MNDGNQQIRIRKWSVSKVVVSTWSVGLPVGFDLPSIKFEHCHSSDRWAIDWLQWACIATGPIIRIKVDYPERHLSGEQMGHGYVAESQLRPMSSLCKNEVHKKKHKDKLKKIKKNLINPIEATWHYLQNGQKDEVFVNTLCKVKSDGYELN